MSFDFSLIWNSLPLLLAGAGVTIEITAIAVGLRFCIRPDYQCVPLVQESKY